MALVFLKHRVVIKLVIIYMKLIYKIRLVSFLVLAVILLFSVPSYASSEAVSGNLIYLLISFIVLWIVTPFLLVRFKLVREAIFIKYMGKHPNVFGQEQINTKMLLKAFLRLINQVDYRNNTLLAQVEESIIVGQRRDDFLVNISHELRTPMHAILNFAELSRERVKGFGDEKLIAYLCRIEESGERLLKLINGILDLTRLESSNVNFLFEKVNLEKFFEENISQMRSLIDKKRLKINLENHFGNNPVYADKEKLYHLISNLLSNAIKFSDEGKNILIKFDKSKIDIDGKKEESIRVTISDEGQGIDKDDLEVIFEKFRQGRNIKNMIGGSGIGLAICKEVVQKHKGHIWAENNNDKGCKFIFEIPVSYWLKEVK